MKIIHMFICFGFGLMLMGCSEAGDEPYVPSIAELKSNETLVMKFSVCHSGCTKGTVRFENNTAIMGNHKINLTPKEVSDLDSHFLLADDLSEHYFCSARVMISFKKKRSLRLPVKRKSRLYPCSFGEVNQRITPEGLVYHFNETPEDIPFWRLPSEERIIRIED